ncbi:MAG: SGNH/GDSL hydrolase family protein [Chitinophagaceae bacterium]
MRNQIRKISKTITINLLIILIGIIILELFFGSWINKKNDISKINIIRSRTITFDVSHLYPRNPPTIVYYRDQYGLRGNSYKHPKEIQILTIGGSTTDQRTLADGETWQDYLRQNFLSVDKDVKIANAGIDGQSTYGHIKNFDWWFPTIPDLKPKYILFYAGINDFYKDGPSDFDVVATKEASLWKFVKEHSVIIDTYRKLKGTYKAEKVHNLGHSLVNFSEITYTTKRLYTAYENTCWKEKLRNYSERLNILVAKTRQIGSEPIFITQPTAMHRFNNGILEGATETTEVCGMKINGVDYFYMMRELNNVTCSVSRKNNALCLHLANANVLKTEDFYDFRHTKPTGAKKIGDYLFHALKDKF